MCVEACSSLEASTEKHEVWFPFFSILEVLSMKNNALILFGLFLLWIALFPATSTAALENVALKAMSSTSYVSSWESLAAINDGFDPSDSNDRSHAVYGNWPETGTQWVQYEWSEPVTTDEIAVYWFDDPAGIDCPSSSELKYWNGSSWVTVSAVGVSPNQYNTATFTSVTTTQLRLEFTSNGSQSTGILEFEVIGTGGEVTGECPAPVPGSSGTNPLFTDQYTADPAPMVSDCTFYIACGHDEGTSGFYIREWFVLKSTDMVNWTKTVGMTLDVFSWANANAWAGQMVEKDGKFYWYVPVSKVSDGTMAIGVAVADSPEGPFTDAIGGPLIDDGFEMSNMGFGTPSATPYTIDPTVFVDEDGRAYLQYGGFWRMVNAELGSDMISIAGRMVESTPQGFFEAPFLTKRNGTYYVVYAAGQNPATVDWATSSSPMGPWNYGGRILDELPNVPGQDAATSHPGVAEFAGQWYLVYHVSDGPNNGGTYRREVAVDKLFFNGDGSIQKVTPSSGLNF
jgi:hypothetical protein